ncbi:MAG: Peptidase S8 and S53, subtilisin, kexin, sedolisin [Chlorobi bacterium OLB5]|nr:MAG: Peptidase S8 and S53, subtilisin, kexin, sedolisin [Chlorobi bacterium OLB5]
MKKNIITAGLLSLIFISSLFSQLANQNTTLIAQKDDYGNGYSAVWGYAGPNGREYAILGCNTGTAFYDITDTSNVYLCDFVPGVNSGWREMKVFSSYAYVVSEGTNSRLQVIALQYLPDSVSLVSTYSYTGYTKTHTISQSGPYLYLQGGNNTLGGTDQGGITILDITNPTAPVKRGQWSNFYVHDARILNDTIYACNIYDPPGTISVISAANKDNLTNIASWVNNPNPFPHNCAIPNDRRFIYTTDETSSPPGKLKVWDKSNLNNVTLVTTWQPTGITNSIVHNVEIYNNIAVVAHYTAGIRILNITNPAAPVEIAWYDTYTQNNNNNFAGCWGVFMFPSSGKIIGSDMSGGLFVIRAGSQVTALNNNNHYIPNTFALKQNYPNPFNPSTTIEFNIPKASFVTLKIYDVLGKQVGILADEFKQAGSYRLNYDAGRLSSGIYYYTLTTSEGFTETRKMVLNK